MEIYRTVSEADQDSTADPLERMRMNLSGHIILITSNFPTLFQFDLNLAWIKVYSNTYFAKSHSNQ